VTTATVQCVEASALPQVQQLAVESGRTFGVFALVDHVAPHLRVTVLRAADELPPEGAHLVLLARMPETQGVAAGRRQIFQVERVGSQVEVEQTRTGGRSQVNVGTEIESGAPLDMALPLGRRVSFQLRLERATEGDARQSVAGSGTKKTQVLTADKGLLWAVPGGWTVYTDLQQWTMGNLRALGKKLGISTRNVARLTVLAFFLLAAGTAFYLQYQATQGAEDAQTAAEDELSRSQAATQASIQSARACLDEREDLAALLRDEQVSRELYAEGALDWPAAVASAATLGGARLADAELLEQDTTLRPAHRAIIAMRSGALESLPSDADTCLQHADLLGDSLPRYALLWHPDLRLSCPERHAAVIDQVLVAGRWGLSERVAREFGHTSESGQLPSDTLLQADPLAAPRMSDRWSTYTFTAGLAQVQRTMLDPRRAGRPPVYPSQSGLWSLAIWRVVELLPPALTAELSTTTDECITELMSQVGEQTDDRPPGEPVLPDIADVADGSLVLTLRPTGGCLWKPDALMTGVEAAIQAAAVLAAVEDHD